MGLYKDAGSISRFVVVVACCLLIGACGRKGPPRPITPTPPPVVQDLQSQVYPGGVEVSWPAISQGDASSSEGGYRYSIRKTEIKWEDRNCPECSNQLLQEVAVVDPAHLGSEVVKDGRITWLDANVVLNTAYRYQLAVLDGKGHQVSVSNPATVKIFPGPPTPQGLRAVAERQGISVRWQEAKVHPKMKGVQWDLQYVLERHLPQGGWEKVSPVPIKGSTFLDSAVAPSEVYDYRLTPLLTVDGIAIWGESVTAKRVEAPKAIAPSPPGMVWVVPAKGALEIHWKEGEGKVGGYHVYRRQGKEIVRLTANPVQHPPFVDQNAKVNDVYFYAVSAVSTSSPQREGMVSKWVEIRNVILQ